ncbi:MAG: delta-aminolevulinic acid dehydratase [Bacteroidetes bacterium RIFCSPLOWO2_02_FULL_36_8]|nr:MAG: delta-aminolevulinic acid dehydratase [Bacteroidetes bacterium RIFCSPLOWO2_02_FULL_36_8]OFY69962.1 MAG: delta-aminolevulinic acid dehydratase [Bacteroidetes bacterium RIFCSPLOWO2_12_FULL_37_12]
MNTPPFHRHRRLRSNPLCLEMVADVILHRNHFIYPVFITTGKNQKNPIPSMAGIFQLSGKYLLEEIESCLKAGINKFLLFGIPSQKDPIGSDTWNSKGVIQSSLQILRKKFPEAYLISDICFCEYTDHGHCGILNKENYLENDFTLKNLALQAVSHAEAGAHLLAPSGMLDGMVSTIRAALDNKGFSELPIMSYAVKYASSFYGPFRNAAGTSLKSGDRKTHQMNPRNGFWEALSEAEEDIRQGADIIMVKPAMPNLDILSGLRGKINAPLAAYQVSGEFNMLKNAVLRNDLNEDAIVESLISIKRAGAGIIISYFSKELAVKGVI